MWYMYVSCNGTHQRLGKAAVFSISEHMQSNKALSSQKESPTHFEGGGTKQVYIMWSRDGGLDTTPGTWYMYEPNHFIPIFRVSHKPADSKSDTWIFPKCS